MQKYLTIKAEYNDEADIWIATCSEIGLVTDAKSYDALVQRVIEVVEDIMDDPLFFDATDSIKLGFNISKAQSFMLHHHAS